MPRKTARRLAMGTMATMMGTLVMSRVAGSGELSDEILASGREAALGARRGEAGGEEGAGEGELNDGFSRA